MAIKPILFNTEMVRAILDGRKSCTRRILKGAIPFDEKAEYWNVLKKGEWSGPICVEYVIKQCSPYQPSDILYVRETWSESYEEGTYIYKADDKLTNLPEFRESSKLIYRPSIHMPKEAARIWLKVANVRVERLQEITEEQAKAEGAKQCYEQINTIENKPVIYLADDNRGYYVLGFKSVWNSTIKKSDLDRYSWNANPWVWVIEFERCEKPETKVN